MYIRDQREAASLDRCSLFKQLDHTISHYFHRKIENSLIVLAQLRSLFLPTITNQQTINTMEQEIAMSFVTMRTRGSDFRRSFSSTSQEDDDENLSLGGAGEADFRERPVTMLSPDPKRSRTLEISSPVPVVAPDVVSYPTVVPIPSETTVSALFQSSLKGNSNDKEYVDQQYLKPAGVLSFEQVLLPALGLEEERALKMTQSRIQRDAPEYKFVMENCRRLVRESVSAAVFAVRDNRQERFKQQSERRRLHAVGVQNAREQQKQERLRAQQIELEEIQRQQQSSRSSKKQSMIRSLPKNQELWKEVVQLTSSIAQLEKEQRLWKQADQDLKQLEGGDGKKCVYVAEKEKISAQTIILQSQKLSLQKEAERKVNDIVMASDRIQKGLGMVLALLKESEEVRKDLYEKYRKDHMFDGYQSVNNPKGVIRFLSQSQDECYDEY
jgi:hypothetical protein